jgi:hypothetical protein
MDLTSPTIQGTVAAGRLPSLLWRQTMEALKPYGLTPEQYIAELRSEGLTWAAIALLLAEECDLRSPPQVCTIQFWAHLHPPGIGGA